MPGRSIEAIFAGRAGPRGINWPFVLGALHLYWTLGIGLETGRIGVVLGLGPAVDRRKKDET